LWNLKILTNFEKQKSRICDLNSAYYIYDTTALLYQSKTYLPLDTPFQVIVPESSIVVYPNPATNTITIE
jgi:hypothetical protein